MVSVAAKIRSEPTASVVERARAALDAECARLVLGQPLYCGDWGELMELLPPAALLAVELFAPLPRRLQRPATCPFLLGSLSSEEKRDAIKFGSETLQLASRHEILFVQLPNVILDLEGVPERHLTKGEYERFSPHRDVEAELRMDSYMSSLDRLLNRADDHGLTLLITPASAMNRFPNNAETGRVLKEFAGAPLAVWPDVVEETRAAHWQGDSAWAVCGEAVRGVVLSDVTASGVRCLPGEGELDWAVWKPRLAALEQWVVEVPMGSSVEAVAAAREFLGSLFREEPDERPFLPH